MKKIAFFIACAAFMLSACTNAEKLKNAEDSNAQLSDSLVTANAEKDSLLALMNEISDGMLQIKDMENLMSASNLSGETQSKKDKIKADMMAIQQALQERREKLAALEARLKKSSNYTSEMKNTIEGLKKQMAAQEEQITSLKQQLNEANIKIDELNTRVDSLNTENSNVTNERNAAQEEAIQVANQLNTCYFVVGSKNELKKYNIIETGFLRKTKIMEGDFEKSYFTKADKRTLNEIPLHSKKAKILSKQPAGSYVIEENNGVKTLKITNATKFWELSNFLIVQID